MKKRQGFVSNSSSTSFIVIKRKISQELREILLDPIKYIPIVLKEKYKELLDEDEEFVQEEFDAWCDCGIGYCDKSDVGMWEIDEDEDLIEFSTIMDNFMWEEYAEAIGIPKDAIK